MRTLLICPLRNGIRFRLLLSIEPGRSITSRSGPSTVCSLGVNGREQAICRMGPLSPGTTVTDLTSAVGCLRAPAGTATNAARTSAQHCTRAQNKVIPELLDELAMRVALLYLLIKGVWCT